MSDDEKQLNAVWVIMWQLAKLDGLPILIGNQPFKPAKIDGNPHCDDEKVQVAVFELESSKQWAEARECLSAGNEKRAREVLVFYHPWFRSMRDVMWEHLFQFVTPDSYR